MTATKNALTTSIMHAITHLTGPLRSVYDEAKCSTIIAELTLGFWSAFSAASPGAVITIKVRCGDSVPPFLDAICLSSGINWAEWFNLLGGEAFDLVVSVHDVLAIDVNGFKRTIGPQPSCHDATPSPPRKRTVAQQLLEQESEKLETDQLFASLSNAIISPTPTRDRFPAKGYNDHAIPHTTANDALSSSPIDPRVYHSSSRSCISFASDIETESEQSSMFSSRPSSRSSASSIPRNNNQATIVAPSSNSMSPMHRATQSLSHHPAAYQQFPSKTSTFSIQWRTQNPFPSNVPVTPSQYVLDDDDDHQPPVFVDRSKSNRAKYFVSRRR